ncbi:hypothetical protein, partial [Streptomyces zhihengii]
GDINLLWIMPVLLAAGMLLAAVEGLARWTRRRNDQRALDRAGRIARRLPPVTHYQRTTWHQPPEGQAPHA